MTTRTAVFVALAIGTFACSGDGPEGRADTGLEVAGLLDVVGEPTDVESLDVEGSLEVGIDAPADIFELEDTALDLEPELLEILEVTEVTPSCECEPPTVSLTVNGIPADMNGSVPFVNNDGVEEEFRLALPTYGFVVDIEFDCPCGCAPDWMYMQFGVPAGDYEAEDNLIVEFGLDSAVYFDPVAISLTIGPELELTESDETVIAFGGHDICLNSAAAQQIIVKTVAPEPLLLPFYLEDPWLFLYHRDNYSISLDIDADGKAAVVAPAGSNGLDDFLEDLWLAGLGTAQPTAEFAAMDCGDFAGGNECLARELLERTRAKTYAAFLIGPDGTKGADSVNLNLYIEDEAGAPDPSAFAYQYLTGDEEEKSFSIMGFGGGDIAESWVGMSESCDVRNVHNENNGTAFYGCFTTSLMRFFWQKIYEDEALWDLAQLALADVLMPMGGISVGEGPLDHLVADFSIADEDLPPEVLSRRITLDTMLEILATGLGALAAHEMGHSLGLVPKGAPPYGLFAAQKNASFIENPLGSVGPHIDTAGPNLMQAGPGSGNMESMDISMLLTPFFFNPLNLAYLQGRIIVLPKD